MRTCVILFLLSIINNAFCQVPFETKVFIESIIRKQNDTTTIAYTDLLPAGYLNEKIAFIKTHTLKFIEFKSSLKQDSIILTKGKRIIFLLN